MGESLAAAPGRPSAKLTMSAVLWALTNQCECEACKKLRAAAKEMQSELG